MKRLLLFLCFVGAGVYTVNTLFFAQTVVANRTAEEAEAPAGQPLAVRQLRSWGPSLESLGQKRHGPLAASQQPLALPAQKKAAYQAKPFEGNPGQNPEPSPDHQSAGEDKASLAGIDGAEQGPGEWAKIILAARVHSEASVSSPTEGYYRPGTELRVVRRENGWLELSDPVTQKRGWVFEKYLSSIDGPSLTQTALESTSENGLSEPIPSKPVLQSSKKRSRPAKPVLQLPAKPGLPAKPVLRVAEDVVVTESDPPSGRWARGADRRRGIGLFMFGPPQVFEPIRTQPGSAKSASRNPVTSDSSPKHKN